MLAYREVAIQNTELLEPGVIHAHHFLQSTLSCQPEAVRDPIASTALISKRALALDNKELVINHVTRIASVEQEAFHNTINRFSSQQQQDFVLLLNLGPTDRHYCTRMKVVFATEEERRQNQDEGVVLLYEAVKN
jgi:hypothetical protein